MVKSPPHVNIVLSDRNWILEGLGSALQTRLSNIDLSDAANPSADINYYITFACRKESVPTLEMGWFAHMEQAPELEKLFVQTARDIDLPVCHSKLYRDLLIGRGVKNAIAIPPGVDHDRFDVKLRIGVVGRTYHTGRKGEGLIEQVMDLTGIDWHFTGPGWPEPNTYIPDADLPNFYRSLDYVLVPAHYEGGPMCVPEALAVGTPVIASDVGWVPEFPHIPFKTGDVADLRRVLTELIEAKRALRRSTESYTWDAFAEGHEQAFAGLMKAAGKTGTIVQGTPLAPRTQLSGPVRLLLHGDEHKSLGGPTIRVPRTAEALRAHGVAAQASPFTDIADIDEDMVHLFNVWNPNTALQAMQQIKSAGKKVIFSPIYLDLSERSFWHMQLPHLPLQKLEAHASTYHKALGHLAGRGRLPEAVPGYNAMVCDMLDMADHVIFLSQSERHALAQLGATVEDTRASLVRNPVDTTSWQQSDPALFRDTYLAGLPGPEDYVVCIGRIEERKNQLLLARALRDMPLRLVLVGHQGNPAYAERIRKEAGPDFLIVDRLDPASDMLRSALSGARIFALPSWAEGASLAALEAAAMGAQMVLSDRSSEQEYFGELAHYCDIGDPLSIQGAVQACLDMPAEAVDACAQALKTKVAQEYSWERYAGDTAKAYAVADKTELRPVLTGAAAEPSVRPRLVFDVTTLAHHKGRVTGISRVEALLAQALQNTGADVRFICWNDSIQRFIDIPARAVTFTTAFRYRARFDNQTDTTAAQLTADCTLVVPGSAWMQNTRYVSGLEDLKGSSMCSLVTVVHDLIPFKFPFWFEDKYAPVFYRNFRHLAELTDHFITVSQWTAQQTREIVSRQLSLAPLITVFRLGDPELAQPENMISGQDTPSALRTDFSARKYVLGVGAIHARKNYEMLYRVWARFADTNKHGDLHLVIVGGVAWNGKELAERIAKDPRVRGRIHILSNIEDADLSWLYANCLFTAFPSHYEGWGLPVAESLSHGKLCLATSATSVMEIAPDLAEHIDPEDFAAWSHKISYYAGSPAARKAREEKIARDYLPTKWEQTAQELVSIVHTPRIARLARPVYAGEKLEAGLKGAALQLLFDTGWHPRESWGRWSSAQRSSITVNVGKLVGRVQTSIDVMLDLQVYFDNDRQKKLVITTGTHIVFDALIHKKTFPREVVIVVPVEAIDDRGNVILTFDTPVGIERSKQKDTAARTLGLGLQSVVAMDRDLVNPLHSVRDPALWSTGENPLLISMGLPAHSAVTAPQYPFSSAWGLGCPTGSCDIMVPILPGAPAQTLTLICRPVATHAHPVTIQILWNGRQVAHEIWTNDQTVHIKVSLDAQDMAKQAPHILSLVSDSYMMPVDLDLGPTQTIAGFGVFEISLEPKGAVT
jgi:glycosyltransferase involved in cell wall biosynthesis